MTPKQQERWDEVLTEARIEGRRFVRAGVQVILAVEADRAALLEALKGLCEVAVPGAQRWDKAREAIARVEGK